MKKEYSTKRQTCKVTFDLPADIPAKTASLCGEFNGWDPVKTPMKKKRGGGFSVTLSLKAGQEYRFRYLVDGQKWENDWEADKYLPNSFGSEDSVVRV
ncbi:MAG: glycoside hydrolase [Candidatus Latescibacterota bacterium]|nr:MAG: glycoside hydrolase [Candidatus Latescibacterota bacterium]